jgi:hypothetical protein
MGFYFYARGQHYLQLLHMKTEYVYVYDLKGQSYEMKPSYR